MNRVAPSAPSVASAAAGPVTVDPANPGARVAPAAGRGAPYAHERVTAVMGRVIRRGARKATTPPATVAPLVG